VNLQVTNLSKSFYYSPVFQSFSLKIESGEKIGLSGPNGSGKTTLLKMISGIMSIDSGEIRIGENDVNSDDPDPRKNLYYLGHSVGLYPSLTGHENLAFISGLYGKTSRNISDILIKVKLGSVQDKLVKFYSQGMLQRLKLATAIILDPDILLLDEPLTGLDVDGIKLFESVIIEWNELRKTMIIVSHDSDWLRTNTDRIIELKQC
jgi:ABC-2 type transport system ATP-binding protein